MSAEDPTYEELRAEVDAQRQALAALLESSDSPTFSLDREYRYTCFNRSHARVMKALYGAEIAFGGRLFEYMSVEADRATAKANLDRALAGERHVEEAISGDQTHAQAYFEVSHSPVRSADGKTVVGVTVSAQDVTVRRQVEEALRVSETRFRKVFEHGPIGMVMIDSRFMITRANAAFCTLVGYREEELQSRTFKDITHPDHVRQDVDGVTRVMRGELPVYVTEKRYLHKDGHIVWAAATINAIRSDGGELIYMLALIEDITRRKEAEESLRQALAREQAIRTSCPDHIVVMDRELRYQMVVNPQLGLTEAGMLGKTDHEIVPKEDADRLTALKRKVLDEGATIHVEIPLSSPNGGQEFFDGAFVPMRNAQGAVSGLIGYFRNVTDKKRAEEERRQLEAQLLEAQKLQAVGTLAGGIAHEINNVLGVVLGLSSLLEAKLTPGEPMKQDLREIGEAANRGKRLIQDLMGFARRGRYRRESLSVNELVTRTIDLLRRTTLEKVTFALSLEPSLAAVEGDPGQISHALLNLFNNARDAMPGFGTISVSTRNERLGQDAAAIDVDLQPGSYVRIDVTDDGAGMDESTVARAFEPFFTTKGVGQGVGLGLPMVYGTLKNHGGAVKLESRVGKGTTASLFLPAIAAESPESLVASASRPIVHGHGRVLVVDDEPMVRKTWKRVLEALGYEALEAKSGAKALEIYVAERGHIDLVLLDLAMPGMDGAQTFDSLLRLDPEARVLICSGLGSDHDTKRMLAAGALGVLHKPFDVQEMSSVLKELMPQKTPAS